MIDKNHFTTIPDSNINILHHSSDANLTNTLSTFYFKSEFDNLILNSNLDNYNIIK